ncbi:MFS transporter [Geomonas subterranea]|uniref:MFS transporter n=1 Tax=Geomonas subterranea TaxID=2847989 RepID=A0ABX8LNZ2_9BACT|nr:MFS transporter [Geomonas subterranea]QXE92637.1 MFS transporter [Geomonas subterranea]QXM09264.1 MFS transporter [Geomonas subterranea]
MTDHTTPHSGNDERERLLRILAFATFIIFFQAFMVAPIIPELARTFGASVQGVGAVIPAYLIPYGIATLMYGLLADRVGVHRIIPASLAAFAVLTALTATATSVGQMLLWRLLTGVGASGVVPLALVVVARMFPSEERGRPLGWLFGAMAGGMAFGSTLGAVMVPVIGWRGIFLVIGGVGLLILLLFLPHRPFLAASFNPVAGSLRDLLRGYKSLLSTPRGRCTYGYVFLNSIFHSGLFTWLGVYLERRYGLGPVGIGVALLGYGVPGFLLGPVIGRAADKWGRGRLLPIGLGLGGIAAVLMLADLPLVAAALVATILSLGYDMTQPMLAGVVTFLGRERPGQAMGLNVFTLFIGFGLGSLIFGEILRFGFPAALSVFAVLELAAAACSVLLFRSEIPRREARAVGVAEAEQS